MEAITIEFCELTHVFTVRQGDKYADEIGYDEMIGLVTQLTMPEKRGLIVWMRTKEEHQARHALWMKDSDHLPKELEE